MDQTAIAHNDGLTHGPAWPEGGVPMPAVLDDIAERCYVNGVFNLMGGIKFVSELITGISENPTIIILFMMAILFVLGMFLDWVGIALLTMPIFVPIIKTLGFDPVWFGVLFAMNMQVSFLSPPFGPAAFYLKSVVPPDISLGEIFRSLMPFILLQVLAVAMLILFPGIAMY